MEILEKSICTAIKYADLTKILTEQHYGDKKQNESLVAIFHIEQAITQLELAMSKLKKVNQ